MHSEVLTLLAAATGAGQAPPFWMQVVPFLAMGVIFWFLILRPQMRKQRDQQAKLGALKKGDQILTGGGLVGKIVRVDDTYVDVEIAPGTKVKALKATIADVLPPAGGAAAND